MSTGQHVAPSSIVTKAGVGVDGPGYLAGEHPAGRTTIDGTPVSADVDVFYELDNRDWQHVASTTSQPDGTWSIFGLNPDKKFNIVARHASFGGVIAVDVQPSRTDVVTLSGVFTNNANFDGVDGFMTIESGMPPFTASVVDPLPYGLTPLVVDGRKLIIDGTSNDEGLWDSVVRVTASNGVWVDVPVQVEIQVPSDPHWDEVVALLHFNGVDGSTTFSDAKGRVWTPEGGARIDTAYFQFGGSSALFTAGGNIRTDATTDFAFGTGDFTVEAWVRVGAPPGGGISNDRHVFGSFGFDPDMVFFLTNNGNQPALWDSSAQRTSSIGVPTNQWTHVAWSRAAGTLRMFVGGVQGYSSAHSVNFASTATARVGAMNQADRFFNGWMDELRITKGVARYIGNFTPPDRAFPDR